MLFVSKNCSLEKVAFMNSSCFIICELNWIVFMAIVKHFRVKIRLASFYCANLIKYKYTFCLVSLLSSLTSNSVKSHCKANGVLVNKIYSHGAQEGNVNWMNKTGDDDLESKKRGVMDNILSRVYC